ncbi:mitochondrial import inner membrane translocase subunit TIM13 [Acrasis kona]|uniref:Mitochondrial import inner membrane translocase subunit TIM13 n=1 Tax=Acrasis kona TaxID=1008807 RepID=A0AAW2ZBF9_9EUKA
MAKIKFTKRKQYHASNIEKEKKEEERLRLKKENKKKLGETREERFLAGVKENVLVQYAEKIERELNEKAEAKKAEENNMDVDNGEKSKKSKKSSKKEKDEKADRKNKVNERAKKRTQKSNPY